MKSFIAKYQLKSVISQSWHTHTRTHTRTHYTHKIADGQKSFADFFLLFFQLNQFSHSCECVYVSLCVCFLSLFFLLFSMHLMLLLLMLSRVYVQWLGVTSFSLILVYQTKGDSFIFDQIRRKIPRYFMHFQRNNKKQSSLSSSSCCGVWPRGIFNLLFLLFCSFTFHFVRKHSYPNPKIHPNKSHSPDDVLRQMMKQTPYDNCHSSTKHTQSRLCSKWANSRFDVLFLPHSTAWFIDDMSRKLDINEHPVTKLFLLVIDSFMNVRVVPLMLGTVCS